ARGGLAGRAGGGNRGTSPPAEPQREGSGRATVIPRPSGRGRHRRAAPGKQDTPVHKGRMPLKKSSDFGRSRGRCLDFLLLIGAFAGIRIGQKQPTKARSRDGSERSARSRSGCSAARMSSE